MLILLLGACLVALIIYVLLYMFLMGSSAGKNAALDSFIINTLGDGGMLKTVLTLGYVKATARRFFAAYRAWLTMPIAEEGGDVLDAAVITLQGEEKSLLADYIAGLPTDMPLILNMGSYT